MDGTSYVNYHPQWYEHSLKRTVAESGSISPDFIATNVDMMEVPLSHYRGKMIVLSIFPSIDTDTCATSVRRFNEIASKLHGVEVLCLSKDLPYAQARFCGASQLDHVSTLSLFRQTDFEKRYGVLITEGELTGLFARSIVIIDPNNNILYTELVPEITDEPDYEAVLKVLK